MIEIFTLWKSRRLLFVKHGCMYPVLSIFVKSSGKPFVRYAQSQNI